MGGCITLLKSQSKKELKYHEDTPSKIQVRGPKQGKESRQPMNMIPTNPENPEDQHQNQNKNKSKPERKYLEKHQLRYEQLMIMLASSAKKESLKKHMEQRFEPLDGVNYDIDYFVDKFKGYRYHCLETSFDEGILLAKQYILKVLQKYFSKPVLNFYFFYSGHGDEDLRYKGDIVLESHQGKQARKKEILKYSISIEEMIEVWNDNKLCKESHLFIFMDSCYSGEWCERLSRMNEPSLSIFSSCNSKQPSYGFKGGLFFKTIMGVESEFQNNQALLMKSQIPTFISNSNKCTGLTKKHLKLLLQDIRNVGKFNSSTDIVEQQHFVKRDDQMVKIQKKKLNEYEEKIIQMRHEIQKLKDEVEIIKDQKSKTEGQKIQEYEYEIQKLRKQKSQLELKVLEERSNNSKIVKHRVQEINNLKKQNRELQEKTKIPGKPVFTKKRQLRASQFVDSQSNDYDHLLLKGSTIIATVGCFVIGKINMNGQSSLTFTFTNIGRLVDLGVVDTKYKTLKGFTKTQLNRICYNSDGDFIVGGKTREKKKNSFKEGQPITMSINTKQNTIIYKIHSQIKYEAKVPQLNDSVTWVPWIRLWSQNDSVSVSQ